MPIVLFYNIIMVDHAASTLCYKDHVNCSFAYMYACSFLNHQMCTLGFFYFQRNAIL